MSSDVADRQRDPKSGGFTLLEVLLAMAILAIMLTSIYMSFSTAGANVEQAEAAREETDLARTLMTRLSADITNAYVDPNMTSSNTLLTFFQGKNQETTDDESREKIRRDKIDLTTLTNWRRLDSKESDLWEVGYFFSQGKSIVGLRTDFRRAGEAEKSKVNLMVECSCLAVASSPDQLIAELKRLLD